MYAINPVHLSSLEMAKKNQFLSRLDAPDCVGKVLAQVLQCLKLRNAAESTHQKLRSPGQAPHICHRHHTSARVKFYLGCENFLFEHEKEHIFLLWAFFFVWKSCVGHTVWLGVKQMKNMMYALRKVLSDGSGYNLSC